MHAVWYLPGALHASGKGRDLLKALMRAGGLRRACGVLIDYTSLSPGEQFRRYRRWVEVAEAAREEHLVKVALAVSFAGLDDGQREFVVANLSESALSAKVFVEAADASSDSPGDLRARGVDAHPMAAMTGAEALPPDALGIVFLGRAHCLHPKSLGAITRAFQKGADIVYGDSDRIDTRGVRRLPSFRPDFSPDLLFHEDYVTDCVGMTRRIWDGQWSFGNPYDSVASHGGNRDPDRTSAPRGAKPWAGRNRYTAAGTAPEPRETAAAPLTGLARAWRPLLRAGAVASAPGRCM